MSFWRGIIPLAAIGALLPVAAARAEILDCLAAPFAADCKALKATGEGIHAGFAAGDTDGDVTLDIPHHNR